MNNSYAYIISTCDRPELIAEFCNTVSEYYNKWFDVYIYDSSKLNETEMIVQDYKYINYIRIPNGTSLPEKVYGIMKDFSKSNKYTYIWLGSDSLRYKEEGIKCIAEEIAHKSYDLVVLDHFHLNRTNETYNNIDVFFQKCIWMTTLLGSVIINCSTMFDTADWALYQNIFCESEIQNWSINYFYFHRISTLKKFQAVQINTNGQIKFSYLKKGNYWRKMAFKLYCEEWVKLFDMLPSCYTNKEKVLRQSAYDAIIGDESVYRELKMDSTFSLSDYLKYSNIWEKVSYVPKSRLFMISIVPTFVYKFPLFYYSCRLLKRIRKLKKNYKNIIVYGTGAQGYHFAQYIKKHSIEIDMYCTSKKDGMECFCGYPVVTLDDITEKIDTLAVILAMTPGNCKEVLRQLRIVMSEDQILYDKNMKKCVDFELGYKYIAGNAWMD